MPDAAELYLVGDIFDFWFEYRHVVPKGYIRVLGKLAQMADAGITLHLFTGNHDLWYRDYFSTEIGVKVYHQPVTRKLFGKTFYIAHGDGLGPGDHGYKFLRKIFTSPISKWAYRSLLHPDWGMGLANYFSSLSRSYKREMDNSFLGEKEFLIAHSRSMLKENPDIDFLVFGHRHILRKEAITEKTHTVFLGDWINFFSYLKVSAESVELLQFPIAERSAAEIESQ